MKDKEKQVQKKLHLKYAAPTSDPASPAATASHHHRRESREEISMPAPLDLTRVMSGSQRKKMYSSSTPPHTPTALSVDTALETVLRKQQIKQQVMRTASGNARGESFKKRSLTIDDTTLSLIPPPVASPLITSSEITSSFTPTGIFTPSLMAGSSAFFGGMHAHVSPRNSAPGSKKDSAVILSTGGATSPGATGSKTAFEQPKSKFKMAHESFRIRMFQEQYGFEPVGLLIDGLAIFKF